MIRGGTTLACPLLHFKGFEAATSKGSRVRHSRKRSLGQPNANRARVAQASANREAMAAYLGCALSRPGNASLLDQPHALADLGVGPHALLHEFIHLVGTDVDELEAALRRQFPHLRIGIQGCPQFEDPLALLG